MDKTIIFITVKRLGLQTFTACHAAFPCYSNHNETAKKRLRIHWQEIWIRSYYIISSTNVPSMFLQEFYKCYKYCNSSSLWMKWWLNMWSWFCYNVRSSWLVVCSKQSQGLYVFSFTWLHSVAPRCTLPHVTAHTHWVCFDCVGSPFNDKLVSISL